MKKKLGLIVIILIIVVPIFNWNYSWRLKKFFPKETVSTVRISKTSIKSSQPIHFELNNEKKASELYDILSKQHGKKNFPWYGDGHKSDEEYYIVFSSKDNRFVLSLDVYTLNNDINIIFSDHSNYRLNCSSSEYQRILALINK